MVNGFFGLFLAGMFLTTTLFTKTINYNVTSYQFLLFLRQFGVLLSLIFWTIIAWLPYLYDSKDFTQPSFW